VKSQFVSQLPWAAVYILFVGMILKQIAVQVKQIIHACISNSRRNFVFL